MRRYSIAIKVGKKIRIARGRTGLTQEDVSEKIGVHVSTFGRIERGELNASLQTLNKIAQVLKVKPKDLL